MVFADTNDTIVFADTNDTIVFADTNDTIVKCDRYNIQRMEGRFGDESK